MGRKQQRMMGQMSQGNQNPPTHAEDPILTIGEVAEMLGKHRNTISRWISDGIIAAGKHPSGVAGIRQSQVEKMLKSFPI